jgi:hypothetical protein
LEEAPISGMNQIFQVGINLGMALHALNLQISSADDLFADPIPYMNRLRSLNRPELKPVIHYFTNIFNQGHTAMFRNKLSPILLDPVNAAIFGSSEKAFNWDEVVKQRKCVLIDLKNELNAETRKFKMLWILRSFLEYARASDATRDTPISLVVDELFLMYSDSKNVFAQDIDELLNVYAHNYNLWVTLIHQELFQFDEKTQNTLMGMGIQVLGKTTDPKAAMQYAQRFDRLDPTKIKRTENVWGNIGTSHFSDYASSNLIDVIDQKEIDYTMLEQLVTASYKYMDLQQFQFLVKLPDYPPPFRKLFGMKFTMDVRLLQTGVHEDDGFPKPSIIEPMKDDLMRRHGVPIDSDKIDANDINYDIPEYHERKAISEDDEAFS